MSLRARKSTNACLAALAAGGLLAGLAACGDHANGGAGNPESRLTETEATAPLSDAPPELVALREQANEILNEAAEGFDRRLRELRGTPLVVNKWASWCYPCREEFPHFQEAALEHGDEVAFLGLLSEDGAETGAQFLSEIPLPYPSYFDPDGRIADSLEAGREFPATLFIDRSGEIVFTKLGPYSSATELEADIEGHLG